jgi:hypothetical protein
MSPILEAPSGSPISSDVPIPSASDAMDTSGLAIAPESAVVVEPSDAVGAMKVSWSGQIEYCGDVIACEAVGSIPESGLQHLYVGVS